MNITVGRLLMGLGIIFLGLGTMFGTPEKDEEEKP
jgi:hypothetical protein